MSQIKRGFVPNYLIYLYELKFSYATQYLGQIVAPLHDTNPTEIHWSSSTPNTDRTIPITTLYDPQIPNYPIHPSELQNKKKDNPIHRNKDPASCK